MTQKRNSLVQATNMSPFTMYIDDLTKLNTLIKLRDMNLRDENDQPFKKGTLAPLIRVLLTEFAAGNITVTPEQVKAEYLLTSRKNKRSSL